MRVRHFLVAGASTALAYGLTAAPALAHGAGIINREDPPIDTWVAAWAAGFVLIASFVALAVLWQKPLLEQVRAGRRLFPAPVAIDVVCGVIGVALFAGLVYAGLAGNQLGTENVVPSFIYVAFWSGLAIVSVFLGDIFALFNPWRAIARAVAWGATRFVGESMPAPLKYPNWLGRWPAALTILAFTWVELASGDRDSPEYLALLMLAYAAIQFVGMSLWGIDKWTTRADGFSVYFNLLSRISPFERRDGVLYLRIPLSGLPKLEVAPGTIALVCTMIGTTAFDGTSATSLWLDIVPDIQQFFIDLGMSLETALEAAYTLGLVAMVLLVAAFYWLGLLGMQVFASDVPIRETARGFIHSFVPIAAAYMISHYFSLVFFGSQSLMSLISDPLGEGSDILGTASWGVDYNSLGVDPITAIQTGALVIGHVAGIMLGHDRALAVYKDVGKATRTQLVMLVVMVAFTCLGLFILASQE